MSYNSKIETEEKEYFYEILVHNEWKEFIVLKDKTQDGIDDIKVNKDLSELDNIVYGKYFKGCIGYNPSGWWEYIVTKKSNLRYKE